nr:peptidylprolyl isomerase [Bacteroidota bacterium]
MFKKGLVALIFLSLNISLSAQKNSDVLFTVGNESVKVEEFKYIYEKNNKDSGGLYSEADLREYLNLFINFKLIVHDAQAQGLDTNQKFVKEFLTYRNQLAQPYMTDREVTQSLVDEAYRRLQYELRASHILIPVAKEASPKDTLAAFNEATAIYRKALAGENFEELARKYSKDPSVANNGGDLGYFTAFNMIYPFESGAYALKNTGDISAPLRTQYGYH